MGVLAYGTEKYQFDDRLLAHIRVVIAEKLRRHEGFLLSWTHELDKGGGRSSVWVSPSVPISFQFYGSREPRLDRIWVEKMLMASHTARGMVISEMPSLTGDDRVAAGVAEPELRRTH